MAGDSNTSSGDGSPLNNTNETQPALGRQATVWLIVVAVIVAATFVVVVGLLFRCSWRRRKGRRRERGYSVTDGRNDFHAWNPHAPPRPDFGAYGSGTSIDVPPLSKAAAKPAGHAPIMEPFIVDDSSMDSSVHNERVTITKNAGRSSIFTRFSQIGRAM